MNNAAINICVNMCTLTKKGTQITKIKDKRGDITTDTTDIQRIMRDYYKQLNTNKSDNL